MTIPADVAEAIARAQHADWLRELLETHGVDHRHAPWDHEESLSVPWEKLSPKAQAYNIDAVHRQVGIWEQHLGSHEVPIEGGEMTMKRSVEAIVTSEPLDGGPPGCYRFEGEPAPGTKSGITCLCPCGCGTPHYLPFRGTPWSTGGPEWDWDGNLDKPTLSPSVLMKTPCGWHGYLRSGVWESC